MVAQKMNIFNMLLILTQEQTLYEIIKSKNKYYDSAKEKGIAIYF